MFTHIDFEAAMADRAEQLRNVRQNQLAHELHRARRLQHWADRSARISCWLAGLARSRRARVG